MTAREASRRVVVPGEVGLLPARQELLRAVPFVAIEALPPKASLQNIPVRSRACKIPRYFLVDRAVSSLRTDAFRGAEGFSFEANRSLVADHNQYYSGDVGDAAIRTSNYPEE